MTMLENNIAARGRCDGYQARLMVDVSFINLLHKKRKLLTLLIISLHISYIYIDFCCLMSSNLNIC